MVDTGIGIEPDEIGRVFDRFFRSRTGRAVKGTGLGLPIAKTMIEAQGGRISVSSVLGHGTTFTVELPVDRRARRTEVDTAAARLAWAAPRRRTEAVSASALASAACPRPTINGVDLYYERAGSGPPLLFFNGSGATLTSSAPLIDRFRQQFDVLAHDQRGLGRTAVPPGRSRWPTTPPTVPPCSTTSAGSAAPSSA